MYPKIALIGRTNVGKSTLFNLLIEENKAAVSNISGTTRDLIYGTCSWRGAIFDFIDTGGIEFKKQEKIIEQTLKKTRQGIKEANLVIMLIDVKKGITDEDRKVAKILKQLQKPYILVANKADSLRFRTKSNELKKLSLGSPMFISATTGSGTGDLLDEVVECLKKMKLIKTKEKIIEAIKVAIIGKPNVGKSSLLNSLAGEQRAIVSEVAHTTRDLIDILIKFNDQNFLFIDTPGIRKKARIKKGLEYDIAKKSLKTAKKADVILLVTDLTDLTKQDKHLAGEIANLKKAFVIIGNKFDLIKSKTIETQKDLILNYAKTFPFLSWAPVHLISAKKSQKIKKIFDLILQVYENNFFEATQEQLDNLLQKIIKKRRPPRQKTGKPTFIYKIEQTKTQPLKFKVLLNHVTINPQYIKFIERMIREEFELAGVAVIIDVEKFIEESNKTKRKRPKEKK